MRILVHPQRGYYRLFFLEGGVVSAVGQVDLVRTTKGFRPKDYLARKPGSRHGRSIPTKDLVAWVLEDALPVRVQLQMHKYIWPPDATGV
jgi:hypothetical protein